MDEIEKRLKETSDHCFTCYESWRKNAKDVAAREALLEAIHEIRKVASRLEIELAISERDEMRQKPIPIPPHRDAQRRAPVETDDDDNAGNRDPGPSESRGPQHGGGGGHQRPMQQRQNRRPQRREG